MGGLPVRTCVRTSWVATRILSNNSQEFRLIERQRIVLVLKQDSRSSSHVADHLSVAILNIHVLVDDADWGVWVHLVDLALGTEVPGHKVRLRLVFKGKADFKVGSHDAHGHVVDAPFWDGAVDDGDSKVLALVSIREEGR